MYNPHQKKTKRNNIQTTIMELIELEEKFATTKNINHQINELNSHLITIIDKARNTISRIDIGSSIENELTFYEQIRPLYDSTIIIDQHMKSLKKILIQLNSGKNGVIA